MANNDEIKNSVDKEEKATDFIPKKEKPRLKMSRYTVMLVPDSTDEAKTYEFSIDKIARYVVIGLAVIVIIACLIISGESLTAYLDKYALINIVHFNYLLTYMGSIPCTFAFTVLSC